MNSNYNRDNQVSKTLIDLMAANFANLRFVHLPQLFFNVILHESSMFKNDERPLVYGFKVVESFCHTFCVGLARALPLLLIIMVAIPQNCRHIRRGRTVGQFEASVTRNNGHITVEIS